MYWAFHFLLSFLFVDSCPCRAGGGQIAHLCLGNSLSPCDCTDLGTCEVSIFTMLPYIYIYMLHVQYIPYILCTVYQFFSCIHTFLPPPLLQCIDPYINDTDTKQCSLDTDGDMIPDYRVMRL